MSTEPQITHFDVRNGNLWSLPAEGQEDGTAFFWDVGNAVWVQSEIGDQLLEQLEEAYPEGQMILTYAVLDDPGNEREVYVTDVDAARKYLQTAVTPDMLYWADVTDADGTMLADREDLV